MGLKYWSFLLIKLRLKKDLSSLAAYFDVNAKFRHLTSTRGLSHTVTFPIKHVASLAEAALHTEAQGTTARPLSVSTGGHAGAATRLVHHVVTTLIGWGHTTHNDYSGVHKVGITLIGWG